MDKLTHAIVRLFNEERFYAELLIHMDRIITDKIPTAGVCIKSNVQLHINPKFFESLTQDEQIAILKHECQHILNNHINRFKDLAPEVYNNESKDVADAIINNLKFQSLNIAADCAINSGIKHIPEFGMLPEKFGLKPGETMEYYAEQLKNNDKLKQMIDFDGHKLWIDSDGSNEELKEKIRKLVNKAAEKTRQAGKMTNDHEVLVERLNYKPKDWKTDLRRFVAKSLNIQIDTSKKRRNRRYGILHPGVIKREELHIGVAVDTSGSISDEELSQFMAEIANIAKHALVTVVEADTEVKNSYIFDTKKQYKIKGRGGTAYQPALDYFSNETDVDGVIYFGDMDNYDHETLKKPKYPVLWAIVGKQNPPASWGTSIKIEVNRK